jgi:hypothetical protein
VDFRRLTSNGTAGKLRTHLTAVPEHAIVVTVEPSSNLPWKTQAAPKPPANIPSRPQVDVKRLALAAGLLAVVATLAMWAISLAFTPAPVTELERHVDQGPPAPDPKPAEVRRRPPPPAEKAEPIARPEDNRPLIAVPPRVQPPRPAGSFIPVAPIARPAPAPAAREARLPQPELRFETFEQVSDASVYSARDPDVEPPIVLYPQQLGRLPIGVAPEEITYVEVIINEDGTVAAVKSRQVPQSLDESMVITMSLSAAKTWRFQPARKDGRAVKYRHVLPVSLR